jgi:CheY-like chemotaxis protein
MHTIMVVDDSAFIVDVFVTMLERGGYRTISTYGGQECLDLLRTERPDLILLDIMMEPMDGRETLERIKSNPETKDIPVMMLTAKQLDPDEAEEYAIYVEDYVLKPITHRELYDAIEYILNRRARIRQDVEAARAAGVDQQVIDEYARISKSIEVNRRLVSILGSNYNIEDNRTRIGDELARAIKSMNMNISFQEDRLEEIRSQMKIPMSQAETS